MSDAYRPVSAKLRRISGKALLVDQPATRGHGTIWIPRSLIHGADDLKLDSLFIGEEVTFRLMEWKAEEIGLA